MHTNNMRFFTGEKGWEEIHWIDDAIEFECAWGRRGIWRWLDVEDGELGKCEVVELLHTSVMGCDVQRRKRD